MQGGVLAETRSPYDELYRGRAGGLLWEPGPGRLVQRIGEWASGGRVLDAGCGDGKNALALEREGFDVIGVDNSLLAIQALRRRFLWSGVPRRGTYRVADVRDAEGSWLQSVDVLVSYGLFHCLGELERIDVHRRLQDCVAPRGLVLFAALMEDLPLPSGHGTPDVAPASDEEINALFAGWQVLERCKGVVEEHHLPVALPHRHVVTWLVARKP